MKKSDLQVLYSDNHLLVVEKPACMPMVPDSSKDASLLDVAKAWVKAEYDKPGDVFLAVVHRLDRPVSGVVVFARTSKAASRLSDAWRRHDIQKIYWAATEPTESIQDQGELKQWLWKDRAQNKVHAFSSQTAREGLKLAHTSWRVLARETSRTLIELTPHTGRAHQLRRACATFKKPILGDLKYGASRALPDKSIALHAYSLDIPHPTKNERMIFVAECPFA